MHRHVLAFYLYESSLRGDQLTMAIERTNLVPVIGSDGVAVSDEVCRRARAAVVSRVEMTAEERYEVLCMLGLVEDETGSTVDMTRGVQWNSAHGRM